EQHMTKSGSYTEISRPQTMVKVTVEGQQQQIKKESKQTYEVTKAHSLQTAKFPSDKRELSWMMHLWEKAIKHKKGYNSQHTGIQAQLRIYYPHEKQKPLKKQKIQHNEEVNSCSLITICKFLWLWQSTWSSNAAFSSGTSTCNLNEEKQGNLLVNSSIYRTRQPILYHHSTCSRQARISSGAKASQSQVAGHISWCKENIKQQTSDSIWEFHKTGAKMKFKGDTWAIVKSYVRDRCDQMNKKRAKLERNTTMKAESGDNTCIATRMQGKRLQLQELVI
ncbi:hypothetical protein A4A49_64668, partial [Nicotiana attenuata]